MNVRYRINRSQSVGAKMNVTFHRDLSPSSRIFNGSVSDTSMSNDMMPRPGSITPKVLLSNSTVSLQSVCLNDDYIKDIEDKQTEAAKEEAVNAEWQKQVEQAKDMRDDAKLSEVDRFSMCSNRII